MTPRGICRRHVWYVRCSHAVLSKGVLSFGQVLELQIPQGERQCGLASSSQPLFLCDLSLQCTAPLEDSLQGSSCL